MFQGSAVRFHEKIDLEGRLAEAKKIAEESDYAVVCVGTTNEIESEGFDRDTMDLTLDQYHLIDAVVASNSNTVVVNFSGAPVSFTQFVDTAPAIVQAWFPGQEAGDSLAAVLTGIVNPSGKLPLSWPKKLDDNPSFGNFPATHDDILQYAEGLDVGYRWYDRESRPKPLFPFGFGLSYTDFSVIGAKIEGSNAVLRPDGQITVTARVTNSGGRTGKTVIQFYVASPDDIKVPGHARPVKELQAFSKVEVGPGKTDEVTVQLDKYSVSVYDAGNERWHVQKGEYRILIGLSSVDIAHTVVFSVGESFSWTGI